ncbi:hypothetical protein TNIN_339791 [Trichonephila inaurata madagascariensis]|uniref:Uncharacterized protein n=1 Tax=Trichonephila inaurata madagascariensis TaxID=2747483 RepID=A0A8X6YL96_9ARAC|nr:hypothetical protein TNIN_339791 [Trichonephila inaurata madagascariensis]
MSKFKQLKCAAFPIVGAEWRSWANSNSDGRDLERFTPKFLENNSKDWYNSLKRTTLKYFLSHAFQPTIVSVVTGESERRRLRNSFKLDS